VRCGRKRVERIMRKNNMRGAYLRKGWKGGSTKQNPKHTAAPDLVNRDFNPPGPNRLWVTDLVRHEALSDRVVMKGHHRWGVAASRMKLRAA
jgi:transposase InsO family protein